MLLINKIKEGNKDAFNIAFSTYEPKLRNFIFAKTGSAFYAKEVTQITFMKLTKQVRLAVNLL